MPGPPCFVADSAEATGLKWAAASGGLPNSTSYTPTVTGLSIGDGFVNTRYMTSGDLVYYFGRINFGGTTSYSGNFQLSLPATASLDGGARFQGLGQYTASDWSTGIDYQGLAVIPTSTTLQFNQPKTDSTYLRDLAAVNNGVPFSFGNNDDIYFFIWYRKA